MLSGLSIIGHVLRPIGSHMLPPPIHSPLRVEKFFIHTSTQPKSILILWQICQPRKCNLNGLLTLIPHISGGRWLSLHIVLSVAQREKGRMTESRFLLDSTETIGLDKTDAESKMFGKKFKGQGFGIWVALRSVCIACSPLLPPLFRFLKGSLSFMLHSSIPPISPTLLVPKCSGVSLYLFFFVSFEF